MHKIYIPIQNKELADGRLVLGQVSNQVYDVITNRDKEYMLDGKKVMFVGFEKVEGQLNAAFADAAEVKKLAAQIKERQKAWRDFKNSKTYELRITFEIDADNNIKAYGWYIKVWDKSRRTWIKVQTLNVFDLINFVYRRFLLRRYRSSTLVEFEGFRKEGDKCYITFVSV